MQENVLLTHHREDAFEFLGFDGTFVNQMLLGSGQYRWGLSAVLFVLQFRKRQGHQSEEIIQTQGSINPVEVFFLNGEAIHQHFNDVLGHVVGHFESHYFASHPPFAQTLLKGKHQVIGFEIPQFQVGIAGHAEEVMPLHAHPRKEEIEVEGDHLFQRYGGVDGFGIALTQLGGNGDEAGQVLLGNLHPCELTLA